MASTIRIGHRTRPAPLRARLRRGALGLPLAPATNAESFGGQRGGGFGNEFPAAYNGKQTCVLSYEKNDICIGYAWNYANNGGAVQGDKDGYQCNGLTDLGAA